MPPTARSCATRREAGVTGFDCGAGAVLLRALSHAHTLDEVGRTFNVTRERIRQIQTQSLEKLQNLTEAQKLRDDAETGEPGPSPGNGWTYFVTSYPSLVPDQSDPYMPNPGGAARPTRTRSTATSTRQRTAGTDRSHPPRRASSSARHAGRGQAFTKANGLASFSAPFLAEPL
jgi:hypothetical protein